MIISHRYFLIGSRPVISLPTPDGGVEILAWSWADRPRPRDMGVLVATIHHEEAGDVEEIDEETFKVHVASLS